MTCSRTNLIQKFVSNKGISKALLNVGYILLLGLFSGGVFAQSCELLAGAKLFDEQRSITQGINETNINFTKREISDITLTQSGCSIALTIDRESTSGGSASVELTGFISGNSVTLSGPALAVDEGYSCKENDFEASGSFAGDGTISLSITETAYCAEPDRKTSLLSTGTVEIRPAFAVDTESLFAFAESQLPETFSPVTGSNTYWLQGYLIREYPDIPVYIATKDDSVYVYGGEFGAELKYVGKISDFIELNAGQISLIVNTESTDTPTPYTFISSSGSIHTPYLVRSDSGIPESAYGINVVLNDGTQWTTLYSPFDGSLQSIRIDDADGPVVLRFSNHDAENNLVDIEIEYEDGTLETASGIEFDLELANSEAYPGILIRSSSDAADDIDEQLERFKNWAQDYAREHMKKITEEVDKIGDKFDRLYGKVGELISKIRKEAKDLANDTAEKITCEDENCVQQQVSSTERVIRDAYEKFKANFGGFFELCDDGIDNDGDNEIDENCFYSVNIYVEDNQCKDDVIGVRVDGRNMGSTPIGSGRYYNISQLSKGKHDVTITAVSSGGAAYGCAETPIVSYGFTITGYAAGGGELSVGQSTTYEFDI